MSYKHYSHCPYCDTEYSVEYENEDDLLSFCPACGEDVLEDEDEEYIDDDLDGGFWDE